MSWQPDQEERDRTLFVRNLDDKVTDELLFELFLQAGPLERVAIKKDKDANKPTIAFVTFEHSESVPFSIAIMQGICLFKKPLGLKPREGSVHEQMIREAERNTPRNRRSGSSRGGPGGEMDHFSAVIANSPYNEQEPMFQSPRFSGRAPWAQMGSNGTPQALMGGPFQMCTPPGFSAMFGIGSPQAPPPPPPGASDWSNHRGNFRKSSAFSDHPANQQEGRRRSRDEGRRSSNWERDRP